jgi:regulator of CtrA degradation
MVSNVSPMRGGRNGGGTGPVAFAVRLANSDAFREMFKEGMALVEETARYLDGEGRREARLLPRAPSLTYATESMRLTTRLMQLASWLLLQRAVNNGDMSLIEANRERAKVNLDGLSTATEGAGWDGLPERLRDLIRRSAQLQQRVVLLNEALMAPQTPEAGADELPNAVRRDLGRLAAAFGGK